MQNTHCTQCHAPEAVRLTNKRDWLQQDNPANNKIKQLNNQITLANVAPEQKNSGTQ